MQHKKRDDLPRLTQEQHAVLSLIYELYYKQMYQKAYAILRNKQDAEDAVQEAFYHVCLNAKVFEQVHSDSTAALIHTYTRNVAINHYHRNKRRNAIISAEQEMDGELPGEPYDLALMIEKEETALMLRQAVEALDPMYREVIVLKYYEHKRNTEIAEQLGISRNLTNGRIFRAKKMLREILERQNT